MDVDSYLAELPDDRRELRAVRGVVLEHLPAGDEESVVVGGEVAVDRSGDEVTSVVDGDDPAVVAVGGSFDATPRTAPTPWMYSSAADVNMSITDIELGDNAQLFSNFGVHDGNYIYVTGFDEAAVDTLTTLVANLD